MANKSNKIKEEEEKVRIKWEKSQRQKLRKMTYMHAYAKTIKERNKARDDMESLKWLGFRTTLKPEDIIKNTEGRYVSKRQSENAKRLNNLGDYKGVLPYSWN